MKAKIKTKTKGIQPFKLIDFSENAIMNKYNEILLDYNITDCILNDFNHVFVEKWSKTIYTKEDYENYCIDDNEPSFTLKYTFTSSINNHILLFKYIYTPANHWVQHDSKVFMNNDLVWESEFEYPSFGINTYFLEKYEIKYWNEKGNRKFDIFEHLSDALYIHKN